MAKTIVKSGKKAGRKTRTNLSASKKCAELDEFNRQKERLSEHVIEYRVWSRGIDNRLTTVVKAVQETVPVLNDRVDTHIKTSRESWKKMDEKMDKMSSEVRELKTVITNVNANGNVGLSASLKDIYNKLNDLYIITENDRAKLNIKKSLNTLFKNSFLLKSSVGRWIAGVTLFAIGKFIADTLGINLSWASLTQWFNTLGG